MTFSLQLTVGTSLYTDFCGYSLFPDYFRFNYFSFSYHWLVYSFITGWFTHLFTWMLQYVFFLLTQKVNQCLKNIFPSTLKDSHFGQLKQSTNFYLQWSLNSQNHPSYWTVQPILRGRFEAMISQNALICICCIFTSMGATAWFFCLMN